VISKSDTAWYSYLESHEAQALYVEIEGAIGKIASKETAEKYPMLLKIRQSLYRALYEELGDDL